MFFVVFVRTPDTFPNSCTIYSLELVVEVNFQTWLCKTTEYYVDCHCWTHSSWIVSPKNKTKKQDFDYVSKAIKAQSRINQRNRSSYFHFGKADINKTMTEMHWFLTFNEKISDVAFFRHFFTLCLRNQTKSHILADLNHKCHIRAKTLKDATELALKCVKKWIWMILRLISLQVVTRFFSSCDILSTNPTVT